MVRGVGQRGGSGSPRNRSFSRCVFLAALPFGPAPEHREFKSGYIDLPQDTHEKAILSILKSLRTHSWLPYQDMWLRIGDPGNPGGHADAFATSIAMYLRPDAVREDCIINPENEPVDWNDPELDLSRYTTTGVIGDTTAASAELGARLWDEVVTRAVEVIREIATS